MISQSHHARGSGQTDTRALTWPDDILQAQGYETGEREQLCLYIDQALAEAGVDVEALTARHGLSRYARTMLEV